MSQDSQFSPDSLPEIPSPLPEKPKRRRFDFGADGFVVSLVFHAVIIAAAFFVVVSQYTGEKPKEITEFVTGAGGGNGGERAKIMDRRQVQKQIRSIVKTQNKLTVKTSNSNVTLPDMPKMSMSALETGAMAGGLSKGSGGGSGGGDGMGDGVGRGGGRNMVGRFKMVMGVKVEAAKLAVYLDNSGSMVPYLPRVKEQIYSQYPDADIFEYNGLFIRIGEENKVYMGRATDPEASDAEFGGKRRIVRRSANASALYEKLSDEGKAVYDKWDNNFRLGSVGAWLDVMLEEKYDALIIFSDFQDPVSGAASNKWEKRWRELCRAPNAPKIYLFSIQKAPLPIWKDCVRISKGKIKMMTELREEVAKEEAGNRRRRSTR